MLLPAPLSTLDSSIPTFLTFLMSLLIPSLMHFQMNRSVHYTNKMPDGRIRLFAYYTTSLPSLFKRIWKYWASKTLPMYILSSVCPWLNQYYQLSFMQYTWLCVFSLLFSLIIIVRIHVFILSSSSNRKYGPFCHCLGLGHETTVWVYVFYILVQSIEVGTFHKSPECKTVWIDITSCVTLVLICSTRGAVDRLHRVCNGFCVASNVLNPFRSRIRRMLSPCRHREGWRGLDVPTAGHWSLHLYYHNELRIATVHVWCYGVWSANWKAKREACWLISMDGVIHSKYAKSLRRAQSMRV